MEALSPQCSAHAGVAAARACERCGRFACVECLEGMRCLECEEQRWGEWNDGQLSLAVIIQQGTQLFVRTTPVALVTSILYTCVDVASALNPTQHDWAVTLLLQLVLGSFCTAYYVLTLREVALAQPLRPLALGAEASRRIVKLAGVSLVTSLIIGVSIMALVVPGLYVAATVAVAPIVAVVEPDRAAVQESASLMEGRRWWALLIVGLSGLASAGFYCASLWGVPVVMARYTEAGWGMWVALAFGRVLSARVAEAFLFILWLRLKHPRRLAAP